MRKFAIYLRTQFKRSLRHYPAILLFTLLLVGGIVILLSTMFQANANSEGQAKIKVGLVGDASDSYLDLGLMLVQNFDSSQYYLQLVVMDRDSAVEQLKARKLNGFIEVPDDFVDAMLSGRASSITYVAAAGPAVLGSLLVEETAGTVSQMVSESQNGLYGFARYANQAGVDAAWRLEKIDALNIEYVERIFGRDATYDVEVIGLGNNLSFAAYYVCAVLLLMVLLMGTICVNLLTKSDLAINRLLTFRRFGAIGQTVGDYLPFFAIIALNLLLFFVGTGIAVSAFGVKISFLSMLDGFGSYLRMGLMMLPAVMLLTAMQFFLYELTTGVVSAVLLQILSAIALSFASGYLLPLDSLPPVLASASAFLPTGVAFSYVGALFTDSSLVLLLSITVGYSVVLLAAAAAVRNVKIRGSRL